MGASVAKRMENYAAKPVKELDVSVIQYSRLWEDHRLLSQGLQTQLKDIGGSSWLYSTLPWLYLVA